MLNGNTIYPVNFNTPGVGSDHGGNRVFNWQEAQAVSEASVSFEAGEDYTLDIYGNHSPDTDVEDNPFAELISRFEYTDSTGMHFVINPTDGRTMLLLEATEDDYHYTYAALNKELGETFTGGSISFDWFFISDMTSPDENDFYSRAYSWGDVSNDGAGQEHFGQTLAFEDDWGSYSYTYMLDGNASGWQTQVFTLDEDTVYDALDLRFEVYKNEWYWDYNDDDDNGDAYLLVDNIQISGLDEMMQFGQMQDAAWNNSAWMMGVA